MQRSVCLLIFCLIGCNFLNGLWAQTAQSLFIAAPDSVLPLLTANNKADFFDYLDNHMKAVVKDRLDNQVEMTARTPDYIRIATSERSTWEMKVLPTADSTQVICVATTICAPTCDSQIHFYDTTWKPLPTVNYITLPSNMVFRQIILSMKDDSLQCLSTTPDWWDDTTTSETVPVTSNMPKKVSYQWNKRYFAEKK